MAMTGKKLFVLEKLNQQQTPISLPELMQVLGEEFSERTVRRWLKEFAEQQKIVILGRKRSTRYISQEKSHLVRSLGQVATVKPQQSLIEVKQPIYHPKQAAYDRSWIESYQPNKTFYLSERERNQLYLKGSYKTEQHIADTNTENSNDCNHLWIDLSYHSSELEGSFLSLQEIEKLIQEDIGSFHTLSFEEAIALNHYQAISYLQGSADNIEVTQDQVLTLHHLLSDGLVPARYSGHVRNGALYEGVIGYLPIEGYEALTEQLQIICHKANNIHHPYEQSFFLLVHIAYLQPFFDMNGPTSRLSANIPLIKSHLAPLVFSEIKKSDYNSAMLAIYEQNDVRPLAELLTYSYLKNCQKNGAVSKLSNMNEVRLRYRQERRDIVGYIIRHKLIGHSMDACIQQKTKQMISPQFQQAFVKNIYEDVKVIAPQRSVGLGITMQQLEEWLRLSKLL